jgi:hypothetical protein
MFSTKMFATKMPVTKMVPKKFLISTAMMLASASTIAGAQNAPVVKGNGTTVWGKHAAMTVVTESPGSVNRSIARTNGGTKTNVPDTGLVKIFNIMGPSSGIGEQWMAAAFTPHANHTVT